MNTLGLKEHLKPHFDIFRGLDIYMWAASGCIRDFCINTPPKDFDLFFPSQTERVKAKKRLLEIGAKKYKNLPRGEQFEYNNKWYDLVCWDGTGDPPCVAKNPKEMIYKFDYTVEMAALDIHGKFYSHPTFYEDCINKKLVRQCIQDLYPRMNNLRLLRYIKKGYTIDQENLLTWLEDQEATFEYRRQINQNKNGPNRTKS